MNRVVITGAGTVNALAQDVAGTLQAFQAGQCGIGPLAFADVDRLQIRIGAQVKGWDEDINFTRQDIALYDRITQFVLHSARQAIRQSGLGDDATLLDSSGVILGTAAGGFSTWEDNFRAVFEGGKNRVHPFTVPRLMANAAAAHISMEFGLRGPNYTVSTACASSNHAMGQAFHLIRSGAAQVMLTGGAEAMLSFGGVKAWEGLRVMSPDACRPFSANRNGMVMGEGAAVFVFEELTHARARGAEILAEVVGFAMTADAGEIVSPVQAGAERTMRLALRDAGLNPEDIGYVNAHGTGTAVNDRVESAAIRQVFGDHAFAHAGHLLVSSTKSMHGHVIGGTGAVELLACIMALRDGVVAPTIGYQSADPDCALDVVPNEARQARIEACLSNAFAFGGTNAVLALRRF